MINKFNKGDVVVINKRGDSRRGYDNLYGRTGKVQFVKIYEGHATPEITYHVKVDGRKNPNQCDGWFVYDEEDLEFKYDTHDVYSEPPLRAEHEFGVWACEFSTDGKPYIKIKEEKKEMELLSIYFNEKIKQLEIEHDKKCDKIKTKDPIIKEVYALAKKYKDVKGLSIFPNYEYQFSQEILEEMNKCDKDYRIQREKLSSLEYEIKAQLDICETYEQKMNVLKIYNVVDEKGKLNV